MNANGRYLEGIILMDNGWMMVRQHGSIALLKTQTTNHTVDMEFEG